MNDLNQLLVSVIVPAYNSAAYIGRALDSALCQSVPLEVIVIDDGSKDGLDDVMVPYTRDARVRYVKNSRNMGVAATRNRGVSMARGAYVAFLDADDIWAPGKLEKQLALLEQTGDVICSTARELMTPQGTLTGCIIPVKPFYTFAGLKTHNPINCSSVVLRTDVAREFPMHHDDCHEDYLMWLEILQKYGRVCAINEPLLKYRASNTGKSGSKLHSARLTYRTYRRMGFGRLSSAAYFVCYSFHGLRRWACWFLRKRRETP